MPASTPTTLEAQCGTTGSDAVLPEEVVEGDVPTRDPSTPANPPSKPTERSEACGEPLMKRRKVGSDSATTTTTTTTSASASSTSSPAQPLKTQSEVPASITKPMSPEVCQTSSSSSSPSVVAAPIPMKMELHCELATTGSATSVSVPCDASVGAVKTAACTAFNVPPHTLSVTHNGESLDDSTLLCDAPVLLDDTLTLSPSFAPLLCPFEYLAENVPIGILLSFCGTYCVLSCEDSTFEVYHTTTGETVTTFSALRLPPLTCTAISSICLEIYAVHGNGLYRYDLLTGKSLQRVDAAKATWMATTEQHIVTHEVRQGAVVYGLDMKVLRTVPVMGRCVEISRCGGVLVDMGKFGVTVRLLTSGDEIASGECDEMLHDVALSDCGAWLALCGTSIVGLWNAHSATPVHTFKDSSDAATALFTPCAEYLLCAWEHYTTQYHRKTYTAVRRLDVCTFFTISPCSQYVVGDFDEDDSAVVRTLRLSS